jgi:hypothetical protein
MHKTRSNFIKMVCVHVHPCVSAHARMCMYVCMYACVCVCVCVLARAHVHVCNTCFHITFYIGGLTPNSEPSQTELKITEVSFNMEIIYRCHAFKFRILLN